MGTRRLRRLRSSVLAMLTLTATVLGAAPAHAAPAQEPGVTLRVFDVQVPLNEICTLKPGQTPNVDKLMSTIDWTSTADFGFDDYFVSQVLANLTVTQAGSYTFRLTSDDGSRLTIDDDVVVNHDGLHGPTPPEEGTLTLTAGLHPLRIDHFERTGGQQITLEWRTPGSSTFAVVPNSALSTDAGVVRVTAPGRKECEGVTDSPGDGLPLTGVHPGYTLTNLRPSGFQPKVTGMDWLPDGRLVISTWGGSDQSGTSQDGEVYILGNTGGSTNPGSVTTKKIAGGLKEPMGLKVVDGVVHVSEKQRLTRLVDTNGDEVADRLDTVATWPYGGNFHEFAFGLLYDAGFFYLNLSVAINYGGATTNPQPAPNRGTTIKVNKDTGAVTYVAGGLRTPHGIGWGPENGIFVTDNQGGWLPSSKLLHVKQGRFFNHYTNPAGPFDTNPVTPPVLWMPQNEIANSPSTPLYLKSGTFAGQFVIGDVTYGGLQRAYVEKVDGEYQGALFRLTQGLEAGVSEVNLGPDGAIYVGGLGAGGNWGQSGKLSYGLQKLTPNGTSVFDILAMRATATGFELEYTQPLSADTAANLAAHYKVKQWRYQPTASYGGPKIDEETLPVTSATLSADRRKVSLSMSGRKAGHVVYVRSPRPFTSDSGQSLWSTEAWYTLNAIPGTTPPPTGGSNLALDKPATADSSCATTEGPQKAVNGSVTGGNTDKWCSKGTTKHLQVDLGAGTDVNRFVVRHAGAGGENTAWNTKDFTIATSTDGSNWTTRATVTGNTASTTTHDIATVSARYVRLTVTAPTSTTDPAARIYEFEVYGPSGSGGPITGSAGKCLDVSNAGTADGTKVQLWTCNGTNAQKWSRVGDTYRALGKCLDVSNGGTANGTKVQLWTCNGTGSQVWRPQTNGTLLNPQSGKVLEAADGSTADGTQIQIWAYDGGDNQRWSVEASAGARITLLDGDDLDAWQSTGGGAATWPLANGSAEVAGGDIRTRQTFGDFRLHVEWYEPTYPADVTGQQRGNSGIYLQDRYELQVLDSFGDTSLDNTEAGSIYGRKAADSNAATAPQTWQTYDVVFRAARFDGATKTENARVTVRWNGVLVHDDVPISGPTGGGAAESAAGGPIRLQDHGDPGANVRYRTIWIEPLT
ncbi:Glucose/arabinose dehydrogenase, beta-propeller fold [Micromonospora sediminicola]|uniref:Glucose/arabinose dehydrogenase, beta-propeller fold n=1 Tax=Micromonospora sediminicola TaxID=946078 RepID=A0A1A9B9F9_9ACTN|nr:family 16 glycoside hydrolase [Micromonospora sediminicola]SBT65778.1 Glucose/arabinose dehydrogenase, beta-propeller fold [Micromonospora sediminicola]